MLSSRCIVLIRHRESQQEKLILISRRSLEKVVLAAMNAKSAELIQEYRLYWYIDRVLIILNRALLVKSGFPFSSIPIVFDLFVLGFFMSSLVGLFIIFLFFFFQELIYCTKLIQKLSRRKVSTVFKIKLEAINISLTIFCFSKVTYKFKDEQPCNIYSPIKTEYPKLTLVFRFICFMQLFLKFKI